MTRHLFIMLLIFPVWSLSELAAQPQPALTCVSVASGSSDVEVSWSIPSGSFDGFRLSYGPVGGPFSSSDYSNTTSSVFISLPNITTTKYEFFLQTFNNSPFQLSTESSHLQSMLLLISGDGTGVARLDWNHQGDNDFTYRILRSLDNINYQLLATTSLIRYYDTIAEICNPVPVYYMIEHGVCGAKSNMVSATLVDQTPPEDPVLRVVTVENGFAELKWEPSPSQDVDSIIVERFINGWYEYRITGNNNMFTDDFTSAPDFINPCDESVTYIVRAKDICDLESSGAINYSSPHSTILLTGNVDELCNRKAALYWNSYNNMVPPVSHYKVERAFNGMPFIDIGDVQALGSTFRFVDEEMLPPGEEVKYRITAVNSDNSLMSRSCEISMIPNPGQVSEFSINYVTVTDNSFITLDIGSLPVDVPFSVAIYRALNGNKQLVATIPWDASGQISWDDLGADVQSASYIYSAEALDECAFSISESQEFSSILLSIAVANETDVSLYWNNLIGWGDDLIAYRIYKYNDGLLMAGYPKNIPPDLTGFDETDDSDALKTTYVLEAVHIDGRTVVSNEVILPRTARIDVPTAFRPSGVNSVFKPLMKNVDSDNFLFLIYNRWGELVFRTNNVTEGWNGVYNGDIQQGVYVYVITFKDQAGNTDSVKGAVFLLD